MQAPDFNTYVLSEHPLPRGMAVLGEGGIGGKALGLFLAGTLRDSFKKAIAGRFTADVRIPETTVLRSGVFDAFMRASGLTSWVERYTDDEDFDSLRRRFLDAPMPETLRPALRDLLRGIDYPLAVRSSSLLEDSHRANFAGIYLTRFLANRGSLDERVTAFEQAVKDVYASTYSPDAMAYRAKRGIPWPEEKMGILVQRMVGRRRGKHFLPMVGGVAFSKNYYPWTHRLQPEDGVVRLVYGLGTQAVGRGYARVLSPAWPSLRPEGQVVQTIARYSQNAFDALNLETGEIDTLPVQEAATLDRDVWKLASVLAEGRYLTEIIGRPAPTDRLIMTFRRAVRGHYPLPFVPLLRELLRRLETLYGVPLDIEFALTEPEKNNDAGGFHLLQVRPLAARPDHEAIDLPQLPADRVLFTSQNAMGNGTIEGVRHLVLVSPTRYGRAEPPARSARAVGRLNTRLADEGYVLIGPGRWGTQNDTLGVPVSYAELCYARAIVEVSGGEFAPEFSYGTHFFGDLASDLTLYMAVFPDRGDRARLEELFERAEDIGSEAVRLLTVDGGVTCSIDGRRRAGLIYR